MLQHITDEGHIIWQCPHCQRVNEAHISHSEVQYSTQTVYLWLRAQGLASDEARARALTLLPDGREDGVVDLPYCACSARTSVRVVFTESELTAPIIHRDSNGRAVSAEMTLDCLHEKRYRPEMLHDGRVVQVLHDVVPHRAIAPHQELARQLAAIGKTPCCERED